jgi:hypothetical protein
MAGNKCANWGESGLGLNATPRTLMSEKCV